MNFAKSNEVINPQIQESVHILGFELKIFACHATGSPVRS